MKTVLAKNFPIRERSRELMQVSVLQNVPDMKLPNRGSCVTEIKIKLKPKLFDLFQHCELKCTARCCEWFAFDFSESWLGRWCEFRDSSIISEARSDISKLRSEIEGLDGNTRIIIERLFSPTAASLREHLDMIDAVLQTR